MLSVLFSHGTKYEMK